jgi:predicted small lipoprotein YifL
MVRAVGEGCFVIAWSRQTLLRTAAVAALVAAVGLCGCGRKAGLDPPPAAAIGGEPGALQPAPAAIGPDGRAVAPARAPQQHTPLDWLLD